MGDDPLYRWTDLLGLFLALAVVALATAVTTGWTF